VSLKVNTRKKIELNFKNNLPVKQIFNALGKSFNINFVYEKDFKDFMYSYQATDLNFYEALSQLCMISGAKYRVIGEKSLMIYPDMPRKNQNYQLHGVKLFLLKNRSVEKIKSMVMTAFRTQGRVIIQEDKEINGLVVSASHEALEKISQFIQTIDQPISRVEFDVQILEINKKVLNRIGANYINPDKAALSVRPGFLEESSGSSSTSQSINPNIPASQLGKTGFFLALPSVVLDLVQSDSDSKIIARPNLHGINNEKIDFSVGDSIPIPKTTFNAMAGGGFSNIPLTQYDYKDVGIKLVLTPFIHKNDAVTVRIELKLDFITGYIENFPLLGNRELKCTIRLQQGESSIIGGFIRDEERGSLKGLPAISKLPILGRLFGSKEKRKNQTDIIFCITPKITYNSSLEEEPEVIWQNSPTKVWDEVSGRPERLPGRSVMSDDYRRVPGNGEQNKQSNSIIISPINRRARVDQVVFFSIRLKTDKKLKAVSISGVINGENPTIEKLNTNFYNKKSGTKVFENFSESSFDIGYTLGEKENPNSMVLGQLSVKFSKRGEYTISLSSVSATSKKGDSVDFKTSEAKITVY
jgi:general secretion pathway protein D